MVWGILALIILVIIMAKTFSKKSKPVNINTEPMTLGSDTELTNLQVYYNGGKKIKNGETITVTGEVSLMARGFDIKGNEVYLKPSKLKWNSSCDVVHFERTTGLTNNVLCSKKGKTERNIWIKYETRVFTWKIKFQ